MKVDLLAKWKLVEAMSRDPKLSRSDLAVGVYIIGCFNPERGSAWPSFATIGREARVDKRQAKRSVDRLIQAGYLAILKHGGRTSSNHYRPAFEMGAKLPLGVLAESPPRGGEIVPNVVAKSAKESSYHSPQGWNDGEDLLELVPASAPDGRAATAQANWEKAEAAFGAFWQVYPKKENRRGTLAAFRQIVDSGAAQPADLIRVAGLYAAEMKRRKSKAQFIAAPRNWLVGERFLEDWSAPEPEMKDVSRKKAKAGKMKKAQGAVVPESIKMATSKEEFGRQIQTLRERLELNFEQFASRFTYLSPNAGEILRRIESGEVSHLSIFHRQELAAAGLILPKKGTFKKAKNRTTLGENAS